MYDLTSKVVKSLKCTQDLSPCINSSDPLFIIELKTQVLSQYRSQTLVLKSTRKPNVTA